MNNILPFAANLCLNPTALPAWKGKLSQHPTALLDDGVDREGDLAGRHRLHPSRAVQGRRPLLHQGVRHLLAASHPRQAERAGLRSHSGKQVPRL